MASTVNAPSIAASRSTADFLSRLFEQLDAKQARYCVLHSFEQLPGTLESDLDLAIDGREWWRLGGVFAALDSRGYHPVQCLRYGAKSTCFVFAWMDDAVIRTVSVDIVSENREGHLILAGREDLLANRRRYRGFWVASATVEYRYLLAKRVIKGGLTADQQAHLARLTKELGLSESRAIAHSLFGTRLGELAVEHCLQGTLNEILPALRRALWIQAMLRQPWMPLWFWITEIPRIASRLLRPTGLLVAVLGPDGTGKSTLIDNTLGQLSKVFRSIHRYHWRPQIIFNGESKPVADPHARPPYSAVRSLAHVAGHIADYHLGFIFRIRPTLARTGLVLFDRYFHDIVADPRRYRYGGPAGLIPALAALAPKPGLMLVLDADAETILARKKETTSDEITAARVRYRALSAYPFAVIVDASKEPRQVAREACQSVLNVLRIRFAKRYPEYLPSHRNSLEKVIEILGGRASGTNPDSLRRMAVLPGERDPRWLVPAKDGDGGTDPLAMYSPYQRKARLLKAGLSLVMRMPSPLWATCSLSLPSRTWVDDLVQEVFGIKGAEFSVSIGAAGPHQKATLQIVAAGRICGFIKVPLTDDAQKRVEQEAAMLARVSATPPLTSYVPEVIYAGSWNGRFVLAERPLGGSPGRARFGAQHRSFLDALASAESTARPVHELVREISPVYRSSAAMLDERERARVEEALELLDRKYSDLAVACGIVHGDFAPWNTCHREERLGVFDWEAATVERPHDWDLFHFHIQTASLLDRDSGCPLDLKKPESRCSYALYLIDSLTKAIVEQGARAAAVACRLARLSVETGGLHGA